MRKSGSFIAPTAGSEITILDRLAANVHNLNDGIAVESNGTARASNNTVTRNGTGFAQFGTAVFRSRGNNSVDGNTTETSGTITTFGPM